MTDGFTAEEQRALKHAVEALNQKGWGVGIGLVSALGLFCATNVLVLKGGENVGPHLRLLHVYFPAHAVTFSGSLIGFVYAFVLGYFVGRIVAGLYYRLIVWMG